MQRFGAANADAMDAILDAERRSHRTKRLHRARLGALPDGAMFEVDGSPFAVCGEAVVPWSFAGYGAPQPRARSLEVNALTPPSTCAALAKGYAPRWDASAPSL